MEGKVLVVRLLVAWVLVLICCVSLERCVRERRE